MVIRSFGKSWAKLAMIFLLGIFLVDPGIGQVGEYYQIHPVVIPREVVLEVGGLAFNDRGELGVTTGEANCG
jgi:hypothetical protein